MEFSVLCRCTIPYAQLHLKLFQPCRHRLKAPSTPVFIFFHLTLGFKKGTHPEVQTIILPPCQKKCWEAWRQVPLWNMLSCLLYYSLYFFFVFLCIRVITPLSFLFCGVCRLERRSVFEPMPDSRLLFVCVCVLFQCNQLCSISIHREQTLWFLHWICFCWA